MWKTLLIIFAFVQSAHAYKLTQDFRNGFYWKSLPINISIIEENGRSLGELTEQAINEWHQFTGLTIWNIVPAGSSPNIVRWSNNFFKETRMDETAVLAVAIRYTEGPYFARTEIVINGNHSEIRNSLPNLYTTIKHELGHTMGLDHSDVPSAIMWPNLQTYGPGIDQDDREGMIEAYDIMIDRQLTRYISPLAYEDSSEAQGLSCATVSLTPMAAGQGLVSLLLGILISFVRKVKAIFKSKK